MVSGCSSALGFGARWSSGRSGIYGRGGEEGEACLIRDSKLNTGRF